MTSRSSTFSSKCAQISPPASRGGSVHLEAPQAEKVHQDAPYRDEAPPAPRGPMKTLGAPETTLYRAVTKRRLAGRWIYLVRKLPAGAVAGCVIAALAHAVVVTVLLPHVIAREEIRNKVLALTHNSRPRLVIAGDSRAARQLIPAVITAQLGWADSDAANIAVDNGGTTPVWAAYREFSHRFAPSPILIVSVSIWSVNDRTQTILPDDELLWSMGLFDRLRLVSPKQALAATFIPERRLLQRIQNGFLPSVPMVQNRGFLGNPTRASENFLSDVVKRQLSLLDVTWYRGPELDGIRWRQLEKNMTDLLEAGAQVVLFDGPRHPLLLERIADTPAGRADTLFQVRLADLAGRLDVPLLHYDADWHAGFEPNEVFFDVLHVNRKGAALLSQRVGWDLHCLIERGELRAPSQ